MSAADGHGWQAAVAMGRNLYGRAVTILGGNQRDPAQYSGAGNAGDLKAPPYCIVIAVWKAGRAATLAT